MQGGLLSLLSLGRSVGIFSYSIPKDGENHQSSVWNVKVIFQICHFRVGVTFITNWRCIRFKHVKHVYCMYIYIYVLYTFIYLYIVYIQLNLSCANSPSTGSRKKSSTPEAPFKVRPVGHDVRYGISSQQSQGSDAPSRASMATMYLGWNKRCCWSNKSLGRKNQPSWNLKT